MKITTECAHSFESIFVVLTLVTLPCIFKQFSMSIYLIRILPINSIDNKQFCLQMGGEQKN